MYNLGREVVFEGRLVMYNYSILRITLVLIRVERHRTLIRHNFPRDLTFLILSFGRVFRGSECEFSVLVIGIECR